MLLAGGGGSMSIGHTELTPATLPTLNIKIFS